MTSSRGREAPSELDRLARIGWRTDRFTARDGVLSAAAPVAVDYPVEGFDALGHHGGSGYWFDHRATAVAEAITRATDARAIWDVGAGSGAMAARLGRAGFEVVAVEPLPQGAADIARHHGGAVFCASLHQLALPDAVLRIVGLFDVIEHVADPRPLLLEVARVLEPGGVVAVTVPALRALWSSQDDVAGHHRRYTCRTLDAELRSCGFVPVRTEYLFASLVPPAALLRALPYRLGLRRPDDRVRAATRDQLAPRAPVDRMARLVLRCERAVAHRVPLPVGLSVLGIFRAPEAPGFRPVHSSS